MATEAPPTFSSSSKDCQNLVKYGSLVDRFRDQFKSEPHYVARAPGRVNLIGEHIDYMGYSVLPMAIQQDIKIAGSLNDDNMLRIHNLDPKYESVELSMDQLNIDKSKVLWYNYFLCGHKGVCEHLKLSDPPGMNLIVTGSVPPSAGLSSSSAFVCAAALIAAKLYMPENTLTKTEFAEICTNCECYIGTQGGGMDQSISFLAEPNGAKLIDFNPIRATGVKLPPDCSFVIGHSLAELNKAATADFNQRVVECRLACKIIAHQGKLEWQNLTRLKDLQDALQKSLTEMLFTVDQALHKEPYTKAEICEILEVTAEELNKTVLSSNTEHLEEFKLHSRARHVFSEASRVAQFMEVCNAEADKILCDLGSLMDMSHMSTRDDYECSHPDLDRLTSACRAAGAMGSRLTGAGWGGCCVSLVHNDQLPEFIQTVRTEFYTKERLNGRNIDDCFFTSAPGSGAFLIKCDGQ